MSSPPPPESSNTMDTRADDPATDAAEVELQSNDEDLRVGTPYAPDELQELLRLYTPEELQSGGEEAAKDFARRFVHIAVSAAPLRDSCPQPLTASQYSLEDPFQSDDLFPEFWERFSPHASPRLQEVVLLVFSVRTREARSASLDAELADLETSRPDHTTTPRQEKVVRARMLVTDWERKSSRAPPLLSSSANRPSSCPPVKRIREIKDFRLLRSESVPLPVGLAILAGGLSRHYPRRSTAEPPSAPVTPGAPSRALLPPATISTPVRIKKEKPDPAPAKGKRRAVSQDVSADEADAAADSDVVEVSEVVRPPPAHGTRAQRKEKIAARPESVRKRAKVVEVLESEEEELATAAKPDDAADDPPASTTPAAPVAILPNSKYALEFFEPCDECKTRKFPICVRTHDERGLSCDFCGHRSRNMQCTRRGLNSYGELKTKSRSTSVALRRFYADSSLVAEKGGRLLAQYNGIGFVFRSFKTQLPEYRVQAVQAVRAFENDPPKIRVARPKELAARAGLPAPTVYPIIDQNGFLLEAYDGAAPEKSAKGPPLPECYPPEKTPEPTPAPAKKKKAKTSSEGASASASKSSREVAPPADLSPAVSKKVAACRKRANVLLGEIVEHVEELIAVRDQEEEYTGQDFGEADLDDSVRVPDLLTFAEVVDSRESDARVWTVLRKNQ